MLDIIRKNIDERMDKYTDSRQPTNDEVAISWLVSEIDRLNDQYAPMIMLTKQVVRDYVLKREGMIDGR